jgi:hypothetical protein
MMNHEHDQDRVQRRWVQAWEASGLSAAAFCRREGLAYQAFLRWGKLGGSQPRVEFVEVVPLAVAAAVGDGPGAATAMVGPTPSGSAQASTDVQVPMRETLVAELMWPGGVCLRIFGAAAVTKEGERC